MNTVDKIQSEFDEVALLLAEKKKDVTTKLRLKLIKDLPPKFGEALEIGCGLGAFARLLAERSEHVLAVDLSPEMIRIARERSSECPNIEYQVVDVMAWGFPVERFDCIVSLMTLHYLPLEETLVKMKNALRPGGVLLTLDFYEPESWLQALLKVLRFPRRKIRRLFQGRQRSYTSHPWTHNPNATYFSIMKNYTMKEVRRIYQAALPGARVRQHFTLRRYSAIWTKS